MTPTTRHLDSGGCRTTTKLLCLELSLLATAPTPCEQTDGKMPELPEGTINAFIQNKNLAKYGLLKDNDGGFLAATCVEIKCRAPHAIDATLSPWPRRLDGVEAHEGPRKIT